MQVYWLKSGFVFFIFDEPFCFYLLLVALYGPAICGEEPRIYTLLLFKSIWAKKESTEDGELH